jgi:hypothetical protein
VCLFVCLFAAVYFEMAKYEECIKECERAIEVGQENRADFKHLARFQILSDITGKKNPFE